MFNRNKHITRSPVNVFTVVVSFSMLHEMFIHQAQAIGWVKKKTLGILKKWFPHL